jgi:arylsulfatase A-like enzyme
MGGNSVTKPWHAGYAGVFKGKKGETYEGSDRVPFIVYRKNHRPQGATVTGRASCLDVMPAFAEWLQVKLPYGRHLDGESVLAMLTQKNPPLQHKPIY